MNSTSRATRIPRGIVLVLSTLLSMTDPALASVTARMDLEALCTRADVVFVGHVDEVASHYASPGSRFIVTDVTLRSERNLLGVPEGSRFVVRYLGGEVGRVGQRVYGEASYSVGEHVLVFAVKRQSSYYTVGMAQGALHVYRDSAGVTRVEARSNGSMPTGADAGGPPLDDVLKQVRSFLARRSDACPSRE